MKSFHTIESWASSIGYLVENNESKYVWSKEDKIEFHECNSIEELMDQILSEIKKSYVGEK